MEYMINVICYDVSVSGPQKVEAPEVLTVEQMLSCFYDTYRDAVEPSRDEFMKDSNLIVNGITAARSQVIRKQDTVSLVRVMVGG